MDIAQQRLMSQRIDGEHCQTPEEVVRWLGAMQAQEYQEALWAIGLRMRSATVAMVEQAIAEGKIVRTWPMRGTLHFVLAEDTKWMLELTATRMIARDKRRQEQLELDGVIIERAAQLLHDALHGGKRLSRPDVMTLWEDAGISTRGQRGYHLLWYLAQTGLICLGPHEGKQQTFVLLDEWVPQLRKLSREEALTELAKRYVASHGPATVYDFAWWTGLTISDARTGFHAVRSELCVEKHNGQEYWLSSDALSGGARHSSDLYLLPGFDEYLLGYKDRSAVLATKHAQKVVPGSNGVFMPMLVVAGQVVGTWKRTLKRNELDILLKPFDQSSDLETGAREAVRYYCDFRGLPLMCG
ncbi:MAG TPA: winged helix DNA-binding domain-containing protein [Ktedonobacteraceae bacterium]|nr:winged helix DNA-binding domain-containing protein [Ktedonobacteraceae bacterium]